MFYFVIYYIMRLVFLSLFFSFSISELIMPENSDVLSKTHVLFQWEQEPYAVDYNIQISYSPLFLDATIIVDTNSSNLIYIDKDNLEWENYYYWNVRPIFENGDLGEWFDSYSFQISNAEFNDSLMDFKFMMACFKSSD